MLPALVERLMNVTSAIAAGTLNPLFSFRRLLELPTCTTASSFAALPSSAMSRMRSWKLAEWSCVGVECQLSIVTHVYCHTFKQLFISHTHKKNTYTPLACASSSGSIASTMAADVSNPGLVLRGQGARMQKQEWLRLRRGEQLAGGSAPPGVLQPVSSTPLATSA